MVQGALSGLALYSVRCTARSGVAAVIQTLPSLTLCFNVCVLGRSWTVMSQEENVVAHELFKDVKFYVVGDIDQKVSP